MATPVIMPRQGQSVESCIIGKWYKQVGDTVTAGDDLFSYETDKATFDEAAKVDGQLLAIFFPEDDDVPCLTTVCVIGKAKAPPSSTRAVPARPLLPQPQTPHRSPKHPPLKPPRPLLPSQPPSTSPPSPSPRAPKPWPRNRTSICAPPPPPAPKAASSNVTSVA